MRALVVFVAVGAVASIAGACTSKDATHTLTVTKTTVLERCDAGDVAACGRHGKTLVAAGDHAAARTFWERGCPSGGEAVSGDACNDLALMLAHGEGVPRDPEAGAAAAARGCDAGHLPTCSMLGSFAANGLGVPKDSAAAARLAKKACDGADADGCFLLGLLTYNGQGVTKDTAAGRALVARTCDGGHKMSCDLLPSMTD